MLAPTGQAADRSPISSPILRKQDKNGIFPSRAHHTISVARIGARAW